MSTRIEMTHHHVMRVEVFRDLNKVVLTCPTCDRCVELRATGGDVRILRRGDTTARHSGWALPEGMVADGTSEIVEDGRPDQRSVH